MRTPGQRIAAMRAALTASLRRIRPIRPKVRRFGSINMVPARSMRLLVLEGGPIWPDWDNQKDVRHCRNGNPVDSLPLMPVGAAVRKVDESLLWGGAVVGHFGHQIVDYSSRILQGRAEYPKIPFLFLPQPNIGQRLPSFFWSICDWLSLPAEQIRLVDGPMQVEELLVPVQAEQYGLAPPPRWYLELLEENAARQRLQPIPSKTLYVSRALIGQAGAGWNAGESFLCQLLARAGVEVIQPERVPLREQLARYAGARVLIFAEGSAIHGRQLLGRVDQDVVVLNRRPDTATGEAAMKARARSVKHVEATGILISSVLEGGEPHLARSLSLYDEAALLDGLTSLGISLDWDHAAYGQSRDSDIAVWIRKRFADSLTDCIASRRAISDGLTKAGLAHLMRLMP